jgi:hypothetical protein
MKTHKFDGVSLLSGLVITGIGLIFLISKDPSDIVGTIAKLGNWFWPVLFVAIGIAILIPALMPRKAPETIESEGS